MANIEALKNYRAEKGLSLGALAKEIGVSAVTLWRWENGKRAPSFTLLRHIRKITGIAPATLRPDLAETLSELAE